MGTTPGNPGLLVAFCILCAVLPFAVAADGDDDDPTYCRVLGSYLLFDAQNYRSIEILDSKIEWGK